MLHSVGKEKTHMNWSGINSIWKHRTTGKIQLEWTSAFFLLFPPFGGRQLFDQLLAVTVKP